MRFTFTGCGTALVTPFTRTWQLDEAAVAGSRGGRSKRAFTSSCRAARRVKARRCRTTSGAGSSSSSRQKRAGSVPVLAGAGGYDTREVIHAARRMQQAGADGLLSVTPYYNKPTPEGLYQHYRAIADAVPLPDDRLQRARPHRLQRGRADARPPRHHSRTSSA